MASLLKLERAEVRLPIGSHITYSEAFSFQCPLTAEALRTQRISRDRSKH
jgi:hypothetical protein